MCVCILCYIKTLFQLALFLVNIGDLQVRPLYLESKFWQKIVDWKQSHWQLSIADTNVKNNDKSHKKVQSCVVNTENYKLVALPTVIQEQTSTNARGIANPLKTCYVGLVDRLQDLQSQGCVFESSS